MRMSAQMMDELLKVLREDPAATEQKQNSTGVPCTQETIAVGNVASELITHPQGDMLGRGEAGVIRNASIAQQLMANGFKANTLRTNATLRWYEWQFYDQVLVREAVRPMRASMALRGFGLTRNIGNGLGKTVMMYEDVSDLSDADFSMDAESQRDNDRVEYSQKYLPLPIYFKGWHINARVLEASRSGGGESLDSTQTAYAGRKVGELMESHLLNGTGTYTAEGGTIYGLTDQPSRNTFAMPHDWASAAPMQVVDDVLTMMDKLHADWFYGPYVLFVSGDCEAWFNSDYSSHYSKTLHMRLKEIVGVQDVVYCPFLNKTISTAQGLLVQTTPDVVQLVDALPLQNLQWVENGSLRMNFKAMAMTIPLVRATQAGRSGICHCKVGL